MILVFQGNFGRCLTELGRFDEAESLLVPAYQGLRDSLGPQHQLTHKTLGRVITLYESWGKPDKITQYRAKMG